MAAATDRTIVASNAAEAGGDAAGGRDGDPDGVGDDGDPDGVGDDGDPDGVGDDGDPDVLDGTNGTPLQMPSEYSVVPLIV